MFLNPVTGDEEVVAIEVEPNVLKFDQVYGKKYPANENEFKMLFRIKLLNTAGKEAQVDNAINHIRIDPPYRPGAPTLYHVKYMPPDGRRMVSAQIQVSMQDYLSFDIKTFTMSRLQMEDLDKAKELVRDMVRVKDSDGKRVEFSVDILRG